MRFGFRAVLSLAACAAAGAAVLAHYAIDVVGDYALARDTYDDVAHASRELASGIALLLALALAARGLRICCNLAARYRCRLPQPAFSAAERLWFFASTIAGTLAIVPAMELLDDRLGGVAVAHLSDAFGGSLLLGGGTAAICAALAAWTVFGLARWLVSHRDAIVAIIVTLRDRQRNWARPRAQDLTRQLHAPRRRRAAHAFRLCKRGPPNGAVFQHHCYLRFHKGDSREIRISTRIAGVCRTRVGQHGHTGRRSAGTYR